MITTEYVVRRGKRIHVDELSPSSCVKVEVECPECLKVRTVHYRSVAAAGHTICQSCMMKASGKSIPEGNQYGLLCILGKGERSGYSTCKCSCGTVKEIRNRNILSGQRSCGCIKAHNFDNACRLKGEEHAMWKGGISSERERTMQTRDYKTWRESVIERDGRKCLKCEAENKLKAHHIEDYRTAPEKRTAPENGATLCQLCHNEFHKRYGRINTNREQLDAFLSKRNTIHNCNKED